VIIQGTSFQPKHIWHSFQLGEHLASTGRAKATLDRFAGLPHDPVVARLPADLDGIFWDNHDCCKGTAARLLAVATVAVQHEHRLGFSFVPDCAAGTPA
jgi:hypothetical protein